jgi:aconitate hydratase
MILSPASRAEARTIEIVRGSTIVKPPAGVPLPADLAGTVLIKVGDKVTTDHIMPAGPLMKYRSNVPEYAKHVFASFNEPGEATFAERALSAKAEGLAGVIVAGDSYGQGSSREHAALCPMYLGVRIVLAQAIERIHQNNLVNFGILPLVFAVPGDYDRLAAGDGVTADGLGEAVASAETVVLGFRAAGEVPCRLLLTPRQRKVLAAGGLLNYTRQQAEAT